MQDIPDHYYMSNEIYDSRNLENQIQKYENGKLKSNYRTNLDGNLEKVLYFKNGKEKAVWEISLNFSTDTIFLFDDIPPVKKTKTGYRIFENGRCYGYKEIKDGGLIKFYEGNYENEIKSGQWSYLLSSKGDPTILQLQYESGEVVGNVVEFYVDENLNQTTKRSEGKLDIQKDTVVDLCEYEVMIVRKLIQGDEWIFYNREGEVINIEER